MVWPWPRLHALPPTVEFNSAGWWCTEHLKAERLPVLQRLLHLLQQNTAPNFLDLVLRGTRWGTRNIWPFLKQQWASLHLTTENFYLRAEDTWTFGSNLGKQRRPEGALCVCLGAQVDSRVIPVMRVIDVEFFIGNLFSVFLSLTSHLFNSHQNFK